MPIPWTLVWFGVLGHQNKAPNICVCLEKSWDIWVNVIMNNLLKIRNLELESNYILEVKDIKNLLLPKWVCGERNF